MIKLVAIGNLGNNAEIKNVNGAEFISFRLADNRRYVDVDGQQRTVTTWMSCSMDAGRKGIVPYLTAGQKVYIEGYPTVRINNNSQGDKAAYINVHVTNIEFCSSQDKA